MATEEGNETLAKKEAEIRKQAQSLVKDKIAYEARVIALWDFVDNYKDAREDLQRKNFEQSDLHWCNSCEEMLPGESVLLYTTGFERHGSHQDEHDSLVRRVRSFCNTCAEAALSQNCLFKCFRVEKFENKFSILVSGKWVPLENQKEILVDIEQDIISEEYYLFGKEIDFTIREEPEISLEIGAEKII